MKPDTWMPFYIGDFLADTMHLTREQIGAYCLLLFAYWRNAAPLADDDAVLAAIVRATPAEWRKLRTVMQPFFQVDPDAGVWRQKRCDEELIAAGNRQRRAAAGGTARALYKHRSSSTQAADKQVLNGSSNAAPQPSPSPRFNNLGFQRTAAREGGPLDTDAETGTFARLAAINRKRHKQGLPPLKDQKEIAAALSAAEGATG